MTAAEQYSRKLESELIANNFDAADATFQEARVALGDTDAAGLVMELAQTDLAGLLAYAFAVHLLRQEDSAFNHYIAGLLLSTSLCHLPHAYNAALYHVRVAAAKAPEEADYHWLVTFVASSPDTNREAAKAAKAEAVRHLKRIASEDETTRRKLRQHGYA